MDNNFKLLNEKGSHLIATGGLGVYITDGMALTLGVNEAYQKLTDIDESEVIGRDMPALVAARYFDHSATLHVLKRKAPVTLEQTILRTGKKVIVTGNPIFNQAGDIMFVATSVCPCDCYMHPVEANAETQQLYPFSAIENVIATSREMQKVLMRAVQVASMDSTVLIQGESGVGKGVVAKIIHQFSPRCHSPYVTVNMTAIPEELFESEMFGYRGGSFTGSLKSGKTGFVQAAAGGTLFLDEISEVSLKSQAKLLRLLEDREIHRVGSVASEQVNARFIAATNRDLKALVREGKFREDLFYRLNVVPIYIPALRERVEDVYTLAMHFLTEISARFRLEKQLTPSAVQALTDYSWPGNVRELHHLIERLVALYSQTRITREHVLEELGLKVTEPSRKPSIDVGGDYKHAVDRFEKELLIHIMEQYGGNLQEASAALGMHRTTLLRKLQKYNLKH